MAFLSRQLAFATIRVISFHQMPDCVGAAWTAKG